MPRKAMTIPLAPRSLASRFGQVCHVWHSADELVTSRRVGGKDHERPDVNAGQAGGD
jgi:hypothetical protein